MAQWILRNRPDALWARVRRRADAEGWPMRALILRLLEDYADQRIAPSGEVPTTARQALSDRPTEDE